VAAEQPRRVVGGPGPGAGARRDRPLADGGQRGDDRAGRRRHRRGHHRLRGLRVDKAALIESLKRVALVAERNTAVQLAFSEGTLTLDAGSGDEAQASESIEATIQGDDITTGFNPQFLLDGLQVIDEAVVELAFTVSTKPVVISGSMGDSDPTGDGTGFRYLLMPRRLLS
jgi:DNA polymerase-3 subunit beta